MDQSVETMRRIGEELLGPIQSANHKFRPGDKVIIYRDDMTGRQIMEGVAEIITRQFMPDTYLVRFEGDDQSDIVVRNAYQRAEGQA